MKRKWYVFLRVVYQRSGVIVSSKLFDKSRKYVPVAVQILSSAYNALTLVKKFDMDAWLKPPAAAESIPGPKKLYGDFAHERLLSLVVTNPPRGTASISLI